MGIKGSKAHKDTLFLRAFKTKMLILRIFGIYNLLSDVECSLYFVHFVEFFPSEKFNLNGAVAFVFRAEVFGDNFRLAAHVAVC